MSRFQRATKTAIKLRGAAYGPSGAGKTMSSLRIMRGLVGPTGRIAFIDTESNSSRRYADRFDFDQLNLIDPTVDDYVAAIDEAAAAGYDGLVIDSLSHGWKWLTQEVEQIAKARYRGNTWSAWSEGTPLWDKLTRAILRFNTVGHVLATMQSKTEWVTADSNGRKSPQRVGLSPNAGKGIEYEFDFLLEITPDHLANVVKDRTGRFQDQTLNRPGEDFGRELAAWLATGDPAPEDPADKPAPGPAAADADSVYARAAATIAKAKTVAKLGSIADTLDLRLSEGRLTDAEHADLRQKIDARDAELAAEAAP